MARLRQAKPAAFTLRDIPDWVLRRPGNAFYPTNQARTDALRSEWRQWRDDRQAYLDELPVRFRAVELAAEVKRRWPVVDRIESPAEAARRRGDGR